LYDFNPELSNDMKHTEDHYNKAKAGEWKAAPLEKPWEDEDVQVSEETENLVKEFNKIKQDLKVQ
jgi:hypothetical protein